MGLLLELDETVGNKETAKQNDVKQVLSQEDDTLSICLQKFPSIYGKVYGKQPHS